MLINDVCYFFIKYFMWLYNFKVLLIFENNSMKLGIINVWEYNVDLV